MGTRADFYIAKDEKLEWLGSIAWDGYEIDDVANAKTEEAYLGLLSEFFDGRDDSTLPEQGWPWPWEDSDLTDCVYAFIEDGVYEAVKTEYGVRWFPYHSEKGFEDDQWPNMKDKQNVTFGGRSGVMILGVPK